MIYPNEGYNIKGNVDYPSKINYSYYPGKK